MSLLVLPGVAAGAEEWSSSSSCELGKRSAMVHSEICALLPDERLSSRADRRLGMQELCQRASPFVAERLVRLAADWPMADM